MFGIKQDEDKNTTNFKNESVFDPKSIPVHTMQDDLNMLDGETVAPVQSRIESTNVEKNQIAKSGNSKSSEPSLESNSPFLREAADSSASVGVNIQAKNVNKPDFRAKEKIPATTQSGNAPVSSGHNWTMIGGIFVLCVAVLGALGGGYYFYMTRYNVPELVTEIPEEVTEPTEIVPEPEPEEIAIVEKFSADKPNYLMLDVEKSDVTTIQSLILQKVAEIREDGKTVPIEFVVVDANNNPIALKIFALLMKINLSPKMIDNLADDFSLFIFSDGGNARVGLALNPKNSIKLSTDLKLEEKSLVKGLEALFLGEKIKSPIGVFKDSQEGDIAIRYVNLNDQNSLSVDYWIQEGKWFVATSKATSRAIIAKMAEISQ